MIGNIRRNNDSSGNSIIEEMQNNVWISNFDRTLIYGKYVWKFDNNIYYSYWDQYYGYFRAQYILNKSTHSWVSKTWNNFTEFDGNKVYFINGNAYYTDNPYINGNYVNRQYILDKSTSTWNTMSWTKGGYRVELAGDCIWTDGINTYYSKYGNNYIFDATNNTISDMSWNGYTPQYGYYIWTDGDDVYYSDRSKQYVLDKSTNTWNTKTWNNPPKDSNGYFYGYNVGKNKEGECIYYSPSYNAKDQFYYVLDKSTSTWINREFPSVVINNNLQPKLNSTNIWYDDIGTYWDDISYTTSNYQVNSDSVVKTSLAHFNKIYKL